MPKKLITIASVTGLVLVASVPALAQLQVSGESGRGESSPVNQSSCAPQYAGDEDLSESDFDSRPSFFCGYITGNPEDHCITDENGVNIAPDGTTFTVENGIVTLSDGRKILIDHPTDAGIL